LTGAERRFEVIDAESVAPRQDNIDDLLGIVTPSFGHVLFGDLAYTGRVLGVNLPEGYSYLGIAAAILSIIAVGTHQAARWWLVLALVAWLLALGPVLKLFDTPLTTRIDGYPVTFAPPWAFLYQLPGFSLARTPGRFTFTLALAVAALAGYGAATVWARLGRGRVAGALLLGMTAVAVFEYQAFFPQYTVPADIPAPIAALRDRDDVRAVFDVPWGNLLAAKQGMYLQTAHEQPLIAGQVTRRTPVSGAPQSVAHARQLLADLPQAPRHLAIERRSPRLLRLATRVEQPAHALDLRRRRQVHRRPRTLL